jgi:hypothetical protein
MEPRTCNATRCAHCGAAPPPFKAKLRPLTPADLAWYFGEAAAAMGVRSSHGPLVDMAMSGIQGGGRTNGVEARAVEDRSLDAAGRQRCITARLGHLTGAQRDVLEALHGLVDWTTAPELAQIRATLQATLGELANVAPMTATAIAHAARRQAHPPPRKPKDRPSQPRRSASPSEAARKLLADDGALAGSPRGAVIAAVAREDQTELLVILREAAALARDAREAAAVGEARPSGRVRAAQLVAAARPRLASEVLRGG